MNVSKNRKRKKIRKYYVKLEILTLSLNLQSKMEDTEQQWYVANEDYKLLIIPRENNVGRSEHEIKYRLIRLKILNILFIKVNNMFEFFYNLIRTKSSVQSIKFPNVYNDKLPKYDTLQCIVCNETFPVTTSNHICKLRDD